MDAQRTSRRPRADLGLPRGEDLAALARRVVVLGIAVCAPVVAAIWLIEGRHDPWVRWGYPPMSVLLLIFTWVLVRRPAWAQRAAVVGLVLLEGWWLAFALGRVTEAPDAQAAWASLMPTPLIDVIVCIMVGFLFQRTRTALAHGAAYSTLVTVTLAVALARMPGGESYGWSAARYGVYLWVLLVLLLALSRAKERVASAVARAARADAHASQMRDMAYLDELTGVANRRRVIEEIGHQAELVDPANTVCIVYFDLDHFKGVNDTLGHHVGDVALRVVAQTAGTLVREGDLLGRIGGEEFVVVAPATTREQARQLAERLRAALPEALADEIGTAVTASFGVVELAAGESAAAVLRRVDALMYRAKAAGRDQVHAAEAHTPEVSPG
ncbi:GGDEF domain-containing protein [Actinotalea sp. M2MS4P-6]|uniref:GGDEF domain-containing protein n=1 Tax=Actinotalea sp. M2MS4P-6 TaxID=2983762 RepID=UPI0021E39196|nr:GGDEF domain-containing protein [Actinotalea sp. M2MS4P-6]MCV2396518.1 GGDEF domain-containing protein [Actinotalea sp. M2MS4P-6]